MRSLTRSLAVGCGMVLLVAVWARTVSAADLTDEAVQQAVDKGKRYLLEEQHPDGSWEPAGNPTWRIGATSLAILALVNTGMSPKDPPVQDALLWLRGQEPVSTYDISLMIQALAIAKAGRADVPLVRKLADRLEAMQIRQGAGTGAWTYAQPQRSGFYDHSNTQFAILGLREAQEMGVSVSHETWKRARKHWLARQLPDGSWGYNNDRNRSYGSMTVAGIAALVITESMLKTHERQLRADGTPICCEAPVEDKDLEGAIRWLGNNFAVRENPRIGHWVLYHLYGLERAGRFTGRRFFLGGRGDKHDWYREGAESLVAKQNRLAGSWIGSGHGETEPIIGTGFALMFLSKGLAPVLINKLEHGPRDRTDQIHGEDWNRHHDDIRNLTQFVTGLPKWPKLLNWQIVDPRHATVADLQQAPIAFFSGSDPPRFGPQEIDLFREYIAKGGAIVVVNNCQSAAFEEGFKDLVRQMYPSSEAQLKQLGADHPVFRSEYNLLDPQSGTPAVELWGVDVGCRTSIIYAPDDLGCLWDKWTSFDIPGRPQTLLTMVDKAMRVGVNVVAYVTGREVFNKLAQQELAAAEPKEDLIERDLLQLARMRYAGDWDPAPQALRNLLAALNRTVGLQAAARQRDVPLLDQNLFKYPILYMHGRHGFALGQGELERLRAYVNQGGVLFADACCGSKDFDASFRRLAEQLFPEAALARIPVDHELFRKQIGHELKSVKIREPDADQGTAANLQPVVRTVEPFLEGVEINHRYVLVYSKYDISCALESRASVTCTGYLPEDALRIGVNVILYALLQ
ncbi:MAG: DUF4159 domain-containing protein [Planctomycetales bacterium]